MSNSTALYLVRDEQWDDIKNRKITTVPDFNLMDYVKITEDHHIVINERFRRKSNMEILGIEYLPQTSALGELLLEYRKVKDWEIKLLKIIVFKTQGLNPKYDYFWIDAKFIAPVLGIDLKTFRRSVTTRGKFSMQDRGLIRLANRRSTQDEVPGNTRDFGLAMTREAYALIQKPRRSSKYTWQKWYTNR